MYASLAVALAFVHNRPRYFANVMANLLFWLGPDRIIYGTDFPIWYPQWQLDDLMAFQLPADLEDEFGVALTDEVKEKIIGGNIARLYDIDTAAKLDQLKGDEYDVRRNERIAAVPAGTAGETTQTEIGVAGAPR